MRSSTRTSTLRSPWAPCSYSSAWSCCDAAGRSLMADLLLDEITVPLRSFELRLTLAVDGTVALVGPSGAGKTTILRVVAGLVKTDVGDRRRRRTVWFDPARRVDVPIDERAVGYRLPGLRPVPAHDGPREHRVSAPPQGRRVPRPLSASVTSPTLVPESCRAVSANASPSRARSPATRRCSCSTSLSPRSTATRSRPSGASCRSSSRASRSRRFS